MPQISNALPILPPAKGRSRPSSTGYGGRERTEYGAPLMGTPSPISDTSPRATAAAPLLAVDDVTKNFETPDGVVTAVDHISFDVAPGEFLAVIGPSGCGKSTLFNIIGGLLGGYDGRVAVAGETVKGPHASIGMVFQEESTFPWRTVSENVAFPLEIAGMPKAQRIERAKHFIDLVGLHGFENRYPV